MFQADLMGLPAALNTLRTYAEGRNGWAWALAALLVDLAARNARFEDLNG
ncbi:hypothetical protein PX699_27405 [Sphingobium sp. H39-3-25]|jgi:hypothetical protein|nr:hypothetical protein [Novosphingobium naphthalenivorans]MDF0546088.1 hypothetical protein [Sphingobium arseniciresistens]